MERVSEMAFRPRAELSRIAPEHRITRSMIRRCGRAPTQSEFKNAIRSAFSWGVKPILKRIS
jgi:hypothetical protein